MFVIKISHRVNTRSHITCLVKHLAGTASGSVQVVKQFSHEPVISFENTAQLNAFLTHGNETYTVKGIDRPKTYICERVCILFDGSDFWCQANVWSELAPDDKTIVTSARRASVEEATRAFWFMWNHGAHQFKTEEGVAARLTRLKPGYEEVIIA